MSNNNRIWFFIVIVWLGGVSFAFAQDTDDLQPWPIETRCLGEPMSPPDDWSFDGTLIMTSSGRLHTYQSDWDTPRIIKFGTSFSRIGLSPDEKWIATVDSISRDTGLNSFEIETQAIDVLSVTNPEEIYRIDWENTYGGGTRSSGNQLYWLDNETLLYSKGDTFETWFTINPFTGEIDPWEAPGFDPRWFIFDFSPDRQKAIYSAWNGGSSVRTLHNGEREIEIELHSWIWRPDSTAFLGITGGSSDISLYDMDGDIIEVVYVPPEDVFPRFPSDWSGDGRYFTILADTWFIADANQMVLYDTCLSTDFWGWANWSKSTHQIAFIDRDYADSRAIQILDIETWERYVVGYHSGQLIGWTEAED